MKISMFMFITLLLIVWLITGCDLKPSEKVLSNAEIIAAKNECEKGGMGFTVLSANGNYAYPFKVVCTKFDNCR